MSIFFIDPYRFDSGSDPYWSAVTLLLHLDGADGSSTITDSSSYGHSSTVGASNARIRTAQAKFGQSAIFDASATSYIKVVSGGAEFNLNTTAWTFEFFCYFTTGANGGLAGRGATVGTGWRITSTAFDSFVNGVYTVGALSYPTAITSFNTWYHLAIVKDGTELRAYVDGVLVDNLTGVTSLGNIPGDLCLGCTSLAVQNPHAGYMDEIRFTQGAARYTSNFTPPTAPFPNF